MATYKQKIQAEQAAREMLRQGGIRQPEHVEYGYTCIRFFWEPERVFLVIEIDKPPEGFEAVGEYLDNFEDINDYLTAPQDEPREEAA